MEKELITKRVRISGSMRGQLVCPKGGREGGRDNGGEREPSRGTRVFLTI